MALTRLFTLDGEQLEIEQNLMVGSNADEPVARLAGEVARRRVVLVRKVRASDDAVV